MQAWKEQALNIVISKFHTDVSALLDTMHIPHKNEHLTDDQLFSIDIALVDRRVALEVDGPYHFSANTHVKLGEYHQASVQPNKLLELPVFSF